MLALLLSWSLAGQLAGVSFPDTVSVGGKSLALNGLGLREKYFIDVYVGALYLPAKTGSANQAIQGDVPTRIEMHFLYEKVTAEQLNETWDEGFAKAGTTQGLAQLKGMMRDVKAGDRIVMEYVPGTGTSVTVAGQAMGTIAGVDFMKALWTVYLGSSPPTEKLKKGMLGG